MASIPLITLGDAAADRSMAEKEADLSAGRHPDEPDGT